MEKIRILGLAGSLRKGSYNRMLLRLAVELAPKGVEIEIFDLKDLPLFNQDLENDLPAPVKELKAKIKQADGILFASPEANYSIPGVLKNAIDWASRPYPENAWNNKPVALMGATISGFGTLRAQMHLRQSFLWLNMHPLDHPEGVYVSTAHKKFDETGKLLDEGVKEEIKQLLIAFVLWIAKVKSLYA